MKTEVKIGLFAIIIICCSWAGIRFLSGFDVFGRNVNYYASYDQIDGINTASPIMVQGVKVGKVTDILLDPVNSDKVTIKLSVKRRYKIPADSKAEIYSPGLMSSMAIGLKWGSSTQFLKNGDTISSHFEESMMDVATEKLMGVADQITTVGEQLTTTLSSINSILENGGDNIESTLSSLSSISRELSGLISAQRGNLESTIEGLASFSESLGENSEEMASVIQNLNALTTELAEANLSSSLSVTVAELNTTLSKINSAEGSVGKLVNDEELYENLSAVSGSLNELIIDLQSNPKRYVHFSVFGKKE
ncbi:MAG: MlaD family protein [Rikenellaceae bacterium]